MGRFEGVFSVIKGLPTFTALTEMGDKVTW